MICCTFSSKQARASTIQRAVQVEVVGGACALPGAADSPTERIEDGVPTSFYNFPLFSIGLH